MPSQGRQAFGPSTEVLWDVVLECFREAEFLWGRWEHALDSHRHTLHDVDFWVEERLLGAIDGVVVGGPRAVEEILVPALASRRTREASAAAFALCCTGPEGFAPLMDALAALPAKSVPAVARGMELTRDRHDPARWSSHMGKLPPVGQAAVLGVHAFRQLPAPARVDEMIDRSSIDVQHACLRLASTTRADWAEPYVDWGLGRSDPGLRSAAAHAGMILGVKQAKLTAAELVRDGHAEADALLVPLAVAEGERILPLVQRRLDQRPPSRAVFEALIATGTVAAADVCARFLAEESVAGFAADALCSIAGIAPDAPELREEDDTGAKASRADAALPQPDPDALTRRWSRLRPSLDSDQRHFAGRPWAEGGLRQALGGAPTRRRHILATELALRTGGLAGVSTLAWTSVQRAQLAAITTTPIRS